MATGEYATSLGVSSASGFASTALGEGATASGLNSTAIGTSSAAAYDGSTAIGYGAATTRANQMMLGTTTNTYTASGITSAASRAAQSGERQFVTTDSSGNLASDTAAGMGLATTSDVGALHKDPKWHEAGCPKEH